MLTINKNDITFGTPIVNEDKVLIPLTWKQTKAFTLQPVSSISCNNVIIRSDIGRGKIWLIIKKSIDSQDIFSMITYLDKTIHEKFGKKINPKIFSNDCIKICIYSANSLINCMMYCDCINNGDIPLNTNILGSTDLNLLLNKLNKILSVTSEMRIKINIPAFGYCDSSDMYNLALDASCLYFMLQNNANLINIDISESCFNC